MGFSLIAQGVLHASLPEAPWREVVAKLGYAIGSVKERSDSRLARCVSSCQVAHSESARLRVPVRRAEADESGDEINELLWGPRARPGHAFPPRA